MADGAYAKAAFLKPMRALGVTVVSRLRKDAARYTLPGPRPAGQRDRPRVYGEPRISLAQRGGPRRGWTHTTFDLYGRSVEKAYKTFAATGRPAGGAIRVVLVDEPTGGVAFFCSDPTASVADVVEAVADRFSLEAAFRDCQGVVGAGQQQVRFVWANGGAFPMCLGTLVMTEAWAWSRGASGLVGHRSARPWDDEPRRPSHADKRRAWKRELLGEEIRAALRAGANEAEIAATAERLLDLAV